MMLLRRSAIVVGMTVGFMALALTGVAIGILGALCLASVLG